MSDQPSDLERSLSAGSSNDQPVDDHTVYYEGTPRLRGELSVLAIWTLIGAVIIAAPYLLALAKVEFSWIVYAVCILIGIICWVIPSLLVRRNYYRITNYRIDWEHGLIFKSMDTLELWHVEDVSLRQGPLDRIFNVGTIMVISGDQTTPQLPLRSISHPRKLLETLKSRIIAVKRQRGVVKLDMG